jgi:hypothetical protein
MLRKLVIERFKTQTAKDKQNLGLMFLIGEDGKILHKNFTLELPDLNNARRRSNIPKGTYTVKKRRSPKYGEHFHITDVPNRDMILIHNGNYHTQILGCVLVGSDIVDINKDGVLDVTNSVNTMKTLVKLLPNEFKLEII